MAEMNVPECIDIDEHLSIDYRLRGCARTKRAGVLGRKRQFGNHRVDTILAHPVCDGEHSWLPCEDVVPDKAG